jgi:spore coat polysaccharide biosynthesis predicted glycosyltransferase SpsG
MKPEVLAQMPDTREEVLDDLATLIKSLAPIIKVVSETSHRSTVYQVGAAAKALNKLDMKTQFSDLPDLMKKYEALIHEIAE